MKRVKNKIKSIAKKIDYVIYMIAVNAAVYIVVAKHIIKKKKDE